MRSPDKEVRSNMQQTTYNAKAYSAASEKSGLASTKIKRRNPTDRDVQIEILFCGICHSDLHSVRNEWSYQGRIRGDQV
jgi:D-arabinose 1-dehydrogenase-like Zn-dependent alcohol dehydrogenase